MKDTFKDRDALRENNFGAMRLIFALCVIASHTYAAFGGDLQRREWLLAGTGFQMDLGALAVNSFFAISGFLITLSWMRTPTLKTFLMKRSLRIYPGFLLASLISLLIVGPLAGAHLSAAMKPIEICKAIARLMFLSPPQVNGAFEFEPSPVLNLSLWTIRYEFICYLMVPLLLWTFTKSGSKWGAKSVRLGITALCAIMLLWHGSQGQYLVDDGYSIPILGSTSIWPKFLCYFVCGMFFAVNRDKIPFRHSIAAVCLAAMIVTGIYGGFFFAMATAGVYLVFYCAYLRNVPTFGIGDRVDLSYGAYLYGWPVQMLIIHYFRAQLWPWQVMLLAIPASLILAAMSWYLVESPCLREKKKLLRRAAAEDPGTIKLTPPTNYPFLRSA